MSLVQFLRILYARRIIILAALLTCVVIAGITSLALPERYTATTRLLLDVAKPDPVTGEQLSVRSIGAFAQTQVELIKDYRTAGRVVDALGWTNSPALNAQYLASGDSERIDLRRWLSQRIIAGTDAGLVGGTQIMEIRYTASSPDAAKQIADLVRNAYLEENLRFRRASAGGIAEWYSEQAAKSLERLRAAEAERNQFASANGIVLDQNSVDLETSKLQALSTGAATIGVGGSPIIAGGPSPLDQVDAQIAQASMSLGANHPTMVALKRQRAIMAAAPRAGGGGTNVAAVEQAFERQKQKVLGQKDKLDHLQQLQAEVTLRRDQYAKAAQREADYRLEADAGQTAITPLAEAVSPESPSFPNVPLIMAGSLVVGGGLGVVLALLVELLARRVRSADDMAYAAQVPNLATIGRQRSPNALSSKIIRFLERHRKRDAGEAIKV